MYSTIKNLLKFFTTGFPKVNLNRAATINDGIKLLTNDEQLFFQKEYINQLNNNIKVVKMIPASGAATRMFQFLLAYAASKKEAENDLINTFFNNIDLFPFANKLPKNVSNLALIKYILLENGLNFANLPKALIPFHTNKNKVKTALEEQFKEALSYCKNKDGEVNLHFTISPNHHQLFAKKIAVISKQWKNIKFIVDLSEQAKSTNTIAVNLDNTPFVLSNGSILNRPAGHGALLNNLQTIDADIIFIKNIDNVQPDRLKPEVIKWKQILGGQLFFIKSKITLFLNQLQQSNCNKNTVNEAILFIKNQLETPYFTPQKENIQQQLFDFLNRPIRVCGMVKNEGASGGGPFWVNKNGKETLQIIENSQVDLTIEYEKTIFNSSTHFNPVDLVCSTKNYLGEKFDLSKYRDNETGFISQKSYKGTPIKALELPGLWNGAMANWITIFIEVPSATFSPVKTVLDLLKPEHQEY